MSKANLKKITTLIPEDLLCEAQEITGEGITETIKRGLLLLSSRKVCLKLKCFKGKFTSSLELDKLREDR